MNSRFAGALALAGCLALAGRAPAQSRDYGPVILRLPAGPRTLALGNTGIASRDDEVIFFNPAQLVQATGFGVSGERLTPFSGVGALSAVTRFHGGGIGIGMRFASYKSWIGQFPANRESMLPFSDGMPGSALEASLGLGQTIKGVRMGVAAKFAQETTNGGQLTQPTADIGFSKDVFRMTVGLAVQNIGTDETVTLPVNDPNVGDGSGNAANGRRRIFLPLRTTLGVNHSRQAGPLDLNVTAAASLLRADFFQPSGGLEANYSWLSGYNVALRAGARRSALGERPFTAGAGVTVDRLSLDYAVETLVGGRIAHSFGLRIR